MARVKTFSEEEIVEKAMVLFWEKGYEATSLSDLTEHLGIGKGSFYSTFKSKEELFNRCVEKYTDSNLPFLDRALDPGLDYKVGLRKLLGSYVEGLMNDHKRKGCFMANSCSLVHEHNTRIGIKIEKHYARIEAYFKGYLEKNGIEKERAQAVSATIITFLIGASQQSKVNRNKESYLFTVENIIRLLG